MNFPFIIHITPPEKNKTGGGLVLFIRNDYRSAVSTHQCSLHEFTNPLLVNSEGTVTESVFIELTLLNNGRKVVIDCVYRPPDTDINDFNEFMANTLDQITKEGKMCYMFSPCL